MSTTCAWLTVAALSMPSPKSNQIAGGYDGVPTNLDQKGPKLLCGTACHQPDGECGSAIERVWALATCSCAGAYAPLALEAQASASSAGSCQLHAPTGPPAGCLECTTNTWSRCKSECPLSSPGELPRILLIGAAKSGSSSLYQTLVNHQHAVCRATPAPPYLYDMTTAARESASSTNFEDKELHYYDFPARAKLGSAWYRTNFVRARLDPADKQLLSARGALATDCDFIDATPDYLQSSDAPARVNATYPMAIQQHLRIVVVLREPVARDVSAYNFYESKESGVAGKMGYTANAAQALLEETALPLSSELFLGVYSQQLRLWRRYLPHARFHAINMASLVHKPTQEFENLGAFLQLPLTPVETLAEANKGMHDGQQTVTLSGEIRTQAGFESPAELPVRLCQELSLFYHPHNLDLYELLSFWRTKDEAATGRTLAAFEPFSDVECADGDFDPAGELDFNRSHTVPFLRGLLARELAVNGLPPNSKSMYAARGRRSYGR